MLLSGPDLLATTLQYRTALIVQDHNSDNYLVDGSPALQHSTLLESFRAVAKDSRVIWAGEMCFDESGLITAVNDTAGIRMEKPGLVQGNGTDPMELIRPSALLHPAACHTEFDPGIPRVEQHLSPLTAGFKALRHDFASHYLSPLITITENPELLSWKVTKKEVQKILNKGVRVNTGKSSEYLSQNLIFEALSAAAPGSSFPEKQQSRLEELVEKLSISPDSGSESDYQEFSVLLRSLLNHIRVTMKESRQKVRIIRLS